MVYQNRSDHESPFDLGHFLQVFAAGGADPPLDSQVDQVGQEGRDREAVEQGGPPQKNDDQGVDLLELVAVGKNVADQVEAVVEVDESMAAASVLPEVDGGRSTVALEG